MSELLYVNMLGEFSLERGGRRIDDGSNRMRKVWLLLAYLIYSRNSRLTQEHLLSLLGSGGEEAADPGGRLKAMLYRVRAMLNQIDESAGHEWIIRKGGTYCWNTDVPMRLDVDEFERLYKSSAAAGDPEGQLALCLEGVELYRGDFLPKLSMESWVMPINAYYHRLYLSLVEHTLKLLEARERWEESAALSQRALRIEPYSEELYQHLMRGLVALGNRAGAAAAFEELRELLYSHFGVLPSEESRQLYRQATQESGGDTLPVGAVVDQLREEPGAQGALFCEYDFFKLLYQFQARAIVRSGDVIHIALISIRGQRGRELPRRSLDRVMENLRELIAANLRHVDVFTQCSVSQFIVMLPQANYENSRMVCQRILRAFVRQYPHSPAELHFSVEPLSALPPGGAGAANT